MLFAQVSRVICTESSGALHTWLANGNQRMLWIWCFCQKDTLLKKSISSSTICESVCSRGLGKVKMELKMGYITILTLSSNLYSVFTASKVSGVGTEESPKDTAFKLFRETGKLRSILPDDDYSYPKALEDCKAHTPACDIAVILVNDPFYGGLGDEVAILSASKSTEFHRV